MVAYSIIKKQCSKFLAFDDLALASLNALRCCFLSFPKLALMFTIFPGKISKDDKDNHYAPSLPNPLADIGEELHVDIDSGVHETIEKGRSFDKVFNTSIDINLAHPSDMDDEIANVDVSDDVVDNGPNVAEALIA